MAGFIEDFMKSYGPEVSKQLSSTLGINKKTATNLIPQIAPLILSGLKKQKDNQGGAPRVDKILNKYGNPDVLDHLGDLFKTKANESAPDPRLGGLLGDSGVQAANMLSKQFKLDSSIAYKIIPMLAPVLLGALTRKRDGEVGSKGIASILDQDGDGDILDDVAGFLTSGLGGKKGGGALGSILGGLLGGKKR